LNIDARPRKLIKKWECNLLINGQTSKYYQKGNEFPTQLNIKLKPFTADLSEADSLSISVKGFDSTGKETMNSFNINIRHKIIKERKPETNSDGYGVYYLIPPQIDFNCRLFKQIMNSIKEEISDNSKVNIEYLKNNQTQQVADKLKVTLSQNKKSKIILLPQTSSQFQTEEKFAPYLFKITIER